MPLAEAAYLDTLYGHSPSSTGADVLHGGHSSCATGDIEPSVLHLHLHCRGRQHHIPASFFDIPGMGGPASTTSGMPGSAPVAEKPQPKLSPPPGHPLWMQPPAVRASIYSNIAKKKMMEAKEHADIAQKEAGKADDEYRKSLSFATEAAARRDACMKYELHAGLVRTLNRLVGFGARSQVLAEEGKAPLGASPPELQQVGGMIFKVNAELKRIDVDIANLEHIGKKLREAEGFKLQATKVQKPLARLEQQRDRLQEMRDDFLKAESIMKAQLLENLGPPHLPKGLLRPSSDKHAGEPYWPEKPPLPANAHRLMLVKPLKPGPGFGTPEGASFL